MKPIRVSLNQKINRSYQILFGSIEKELGLQLRRTSTESKKILLVTSAAVCRSGHANRLKKSLVKNGFTVNMVKLPNGEKVKNLTTLSSLYKRGLQFELDRKSTVVGLGGGVVTDVAGFFAATYMRGISFVAVPTTLLGMVDASIGGKTGVDLAQGKNMVGAFWQPQLVWIDQKVLKSLPKRELITGFAEILKYGVIQDKQFFYWLQNKIRQKPDITKWSEKDISRAIHRSVEIKAHVVSRDEKETPLKGGREILNFGHTIGHALEAATGYESFSHGEAISIGMVAAGLIARHYKMWSDDEQLQLLSTLQVAGLPIHIPARIKINTQKFWKALRSDKKNVSGKLRFVLPQKMGSVKLQNGVKPALIHGIMRTIGMGV